MPRPKPYNPAHDRRATDLTRLAEVAPIEVDDPMGLDPGDKIVVMRSIRDDPLARLHAHRHIDEAQYQGGRAFQYDFETAEQGPQAIDPTKEYVDGGRPPEPLPECAQEALQRLNRVARVLGQDGSALTHAVLINSQTCKAVAVSRGLPGRKWEEFFNMRLKECLNTLAAVYKFSG